jgi:hypothetical protein
MSAQSGSESGSLVPAGLMVIGTKASRQGTCTPRAPRYSDPRSPADDNGQVTVRAARFSGGAVSFSGAEFSGGVVDFIGARFSGGTVGFSGARFSGSEVNFMSARSTNACFA